MTELDNTLDYGFTTTAIEASLSDWRGYGIVKNCNNVYNYQTEV